MIMTFKTKMRKNAGSMISVVPAGLVNLIHAEPGDELIWHADINKEGVTITVVPQKKEKAEKII